jgi:hypothetical protein
MEAFEDFIGNLQAICRTFLSYLGSLTLLDWLLLDCRALILFFAAHSCAPVPQLFEQDGFFLALSFRFFLSVQVVLPLPFCPLRWTLTGCFSLMAVALPDLISDFQAVFYHICIYLQFLLFFCCSRFLC